MQKVEIKKVIGECEDTCTLIFDTVPYGWSYKAGQYVTVEVMITQKVYRRAYSLATSPYTDAHPAITIKRVAGGIVSNYLNEVVKSGDTLTILPPMGNFLLPPLHQLTQLVLVAGGSGITPLFAMLKAALHATAALKVLLVYASRDEEHIIYAQPLAELIQKHPTRLQVMHVLSKPSASWQGSRGRLTPVQVSAWLPVDQGGVRYFLCGPEGLMQMVREQLYKAGISAEYITQERFVHSTSPPAGETVEGTSKITLRQWGEEHTFEMARDETILDAGIAEGIDIPYACGTGICNICRAKCCSGEVMMDEDEGLSEEELAEGYVLTCVARPTTAQVVLEIEE
jgi:ring-1,2-phenylacetyl-CoA epoxidase subunit PaaE